MNQAPSGATSSEYAAPTGLEFCLGCDSTNMPRLRRWGNVAAARQSVQTGAEFRWRLSPECRYAETDGSRSPQFAIRNSKWSGLLFRFSFCVGRLGHLAVE